MTMGAVDTIRPRYVEEEVFGKPTTWFRQVSTRFRRNVPAMSGLVMVAIMVALCLLAPLIARYDPDVINVNILNQDPSGTHWMGTDYLGRDLWSRLLWGGRVSFPIGLSIVAISFAVGVPIGVTAGYAGKLIDDVLMRLMDVVLAFPGLLLAIGIIAVIGVGLKSVAIALGVAGIPSYARVARGSTLRLKQMDYVEAARAQGAGQIHIMYKHILPNIVDALVVIATLNLSGSILAAAALSFLGLGTQLPTSDWGTLLSQGYEHMFQSWIQVVAPAVMIIYTVLGINLLGDGLGEALNPRLQAGG
jgi:peptide/nickel transport system permease protein